MSKSKKRKLRKAASAPAITGSAGRVEQQPTDGQSPHGVVVPVHKRFPELLVHWMHVKNIKVKALAIKATRADGTTVDEGTITRIRTAYFKPHAKKIIKNPQSETREAIIKGLGITPEEFYMDAPPYRQTQTLHTFDPKDIRIMLAQPGINYEGVALGDEDKDLLIRVARALARAQASLV